MTLAIEIKTVSHSSRRYETAGDWYEDNGRSIISVSDCSDKRYEYLLAIHELVERAICDVRGISPQVVDEFDFAFKGDGEPGDSKDSPYRDAHCFATAVERMCCAAMGVSWEEYDGFIGAL